MLKKLNAIVRKISTPLNIFNIIAGFIIGIAYVFLLFPSMIGLFFGILMAISSSVMIGISYYFTATKSNSDASPAPPTIVPQPFFGMPQSHLFLGIAIPAALLTAGGSFFGMYSSTMLLIPALAFPITAPIAAAIAITLGLSLALGTLANSWLQIHAIWITLKTPAQPAPSIQRPLLHFPTLPTPTKSPTPTPHHSPHLFPPVHPEEARNDVSKDKELNHSTPKDYNPAFKL